ncbi:MAG: DNA mismatch repair endonuclease MutL [Bacteroidia bacterium]|nr:DNA mismatch repair endonuclease MutL [Bacteroidia bacterium]
MADIIQLLPDHVANQIAAGEVVQRPSSVVKELLENSVDAGATQIKLIIKGGGKTLIQVIDNGIGMSGTDARLSFERHATSKIRSANDLFQIRTKGFRGEALASIAAISHVELKTKQENDELGNSLDIESSKVISQNVVVTPKGTSISVKNLFFNIPARRNFLKSDHVENRHIIDEFHRVALAHPKISFSMFQNGNEVFNLPISNFRQRVVNIFGTKMNEKLVPVEEKTEVIEISGFVCKPEYSKKTRGEQFFFVNDRFIKSPYLNHAVISAFEGLIQEGRIPSYFLKLKVDPKSIDINIHPTKTEIKFDDEHTFYAILRSSIKHSLGQFNIAPVLDFEHDSNLETPYNYKNKTVGAPNMQVDRNFNPFKLDPKGNTPAERFKMQSTSGWESFYVGLESKANNNEPDFSSVQFDSDEITPDMFTDGSTDHETINTYQIHKKYIVSTIKSGMLILDQQRAHQRILYEDFLKNLTIKEATSQQLLFPLVLNFSTSEIEFIKQLKEKLESTGFDFSKIGADIIEIKGIPISINESEVSIIIEQLIADYQNELPGNSFSQTDLFAKSMAKSLAIKTGQHLSIAEQEHLVNSLFACKEPSITPNNKPIFITISVDELDKKFM